MMVPGRLREVMSGWVGRHVVLGIRPEHLHLVPIAASSDGAVETGEMEVVVTVVEPLGNHMDVYGQTALGEQVVARVEARTGLDRDARVRLFADLRRVHFFEPGETGMNIGLMKEPTHALA